MSDTLFGFPIKIVDKIDGMPEKPEIRVGPPMYPPFDKIAQVVIPEGDFARAEWIGDANLPLNCSYQFLPYVEKLPWKMVEILDEPHYQIRWFKRVDA